MMNNNIALRVLRSIRECGQFNKCFVGKANIHTTGHQGGDLTFDGQTAVITGAGRGLGRQYALMFASRGANVVINDFGGQRDGRQNQEAETRHPAEQVADEIQAKWPNCKTMISGESVSDEDQVKQLVKRTVDKFNRIDILINNAGILRDKSFAKMSVDDWDQVCAVHLRGSFLMSHTCWAQMREQQYGKIIMTSSTSGIYGNFGQANYSAAKMGLIGLCNTLAIEGRRSNIFCNTVIPMAASRMTMDILPQDLIDKLDPSYVAPLVAWLCHKDCNETGSVVEAAGQWFGRYKPTRTKGKYLPGVCGSVEKIAQSWEQITKYDESAMNLDSFGDHLGELMKIFEAHERRK